nr:odorant receptor 131-2-like [Pseudochaenichthys georgianus]
MNSSRRFDSYNEAFTKNFITFVLVFTIICINGAFVYTYFKSKDFQRDPRYVLYIHLVINDMIMLTLSLGLMIATYTGNPGFIPCWIMLVVSMTTNRNSPLNLAGMAMERYIAVCLPLHHVQICTVQRAHLLIALIWLVSFIPAFTDIIIILITQPLSVFSKTVLCHASFVYNTPYHVTLSLVVEGPSGTVLYVLELLKAPARSPDEESVAVLLFSFVFLTVVLTYLNVLLAARGVSGVSRASMRNARNTILLHGVQLLLCLLSFIAPFINLFLVTNWPHKRTDIFFSTFVFTNILPRLLSPLIYGLRDKKFRANIRMHFCFKGCRTVEERMKVLGMKCEPKAGVLGVAMNLFFVSFLAKRTRLWPLAIGADPQSLCSTSCSASPPRLKPAGDTWISAATPPALGADPQSSDGVEMDPAARPASVWTRSPPTVWVEALLIGRQPSARDRRDPLVVLASLFGNWPVACGARQPGRQLSGRWKRRRDPDTGGKRSGVAKQRPEIQSNHV